jgi:hypothetical protein
MGCSARSTVAVSVNMTKKRAPAALNIDSGRQEFSRLGLLKQLMQSFMKLAGNSHYQNWCL